MNGLAECPAVAARARRAAGAGIDRAPRCTRASITAASDASAGTTTACSATGAYSRTDNPDARAVAGRRGEHVVADRCAPARRQVRVRVERARHDEQRDPAALRVAVRARRAAGSERARPVATLRARATRDPRPTMPRSRWRRCCGPRARITASRLALGAAARRDARCWRRSGTAPPSAVPSPPRPRRCRRYRRRMSR